MRNGNRGGRHPARRQRLRIESTGGLVSGQGEQHGQSDHRKLGVHVDLLFLAVPAPIRIRNGATATTRSCASEAEPTLERAFISRSSAGWLRD
jgi:hypothetical protein